MTAPYIYLIFLTGGGAGGLPDLIAVEPLRPLSAIEPTRRMTAVEPQRPLASSVVE